jgi:hypothetical protein
MQRLFLAEFLQCLVVLVVEEAGFFATEYFVLQSGEQGDIHIKDSASYSILRPIDRSARKGDL